MQLGDVISSALKTVGATPERVERWLGRPCRCRARQLKLNQLSRWATRIVTGKTEQAGYYLEQILEQR